LHTKSLPQHTTLQALTRLPYFVVLQYRSPAGIKAHDAIFKPMIRALPHIP
jgi:hypothetical protein